MANPPSAMGALSQATQGVSLGEPEILLVVCQHPVSPKTICASESSVLSNSFYFKFLLSTPFVALFLGLLSVLSDCSEHLLSAKLLPVGS